MTIILTWPAPLFKKLNESVIEEEYARLEGQAGYCDSE